MSFILFEIDFIDRMRWWVGVAEIGVGINAAAHLLYLERRNGRWIFDFLWLYHLYQWLADRRYE